MDLNYIHSPSCAAFIQSWRNLQSPRDSRYMSSFGNMENLFKAVKDSFIHIDVPFLKSITAAPRTKEEQRMRDKVEELFFLIGDPYSILYAAEKLDLTQTIDQMLEAIHNPKNPIPLLHLKEILPLCGEKIIELDFSFLLSPFEYNSISNSILYDFVKCCPNVERVSFLSCNKLTWNNLVFTLSTAKFLRQVIIADCCSLSEDWLADFSRAVPSVAVQFTNSPCAEIPVMNGMKLSKVFEFAADDREVAFSNWITVFNNYGLSFTDYFNFPKEVRKNIFQFVKEFSSEHLPPSAMKLSEFSSLPPDHQKWAAANSATLSRLLHLIPFEVISKIPLPQLSSLSGPSDLLAFSEFTQEGLVNLEIFLSTPSEVRLYLCNNKNGTLASYRKGQSWKDQCGWVEHVYLPGKREEEARAKKPMQEMESQ